jgi:hypothetical protein
MRDSRLEGGPWRVTFERRGDRYGHRIELIEADKVTPLLESIEGTPEEDWPASPALKELHLEDRPGGKQLALLVGMAGRSHWSMSVELDPQAAQLVFDVACRLRDEPRQLSSTYRVAALPVRLLTDPPRVAGPQGFELQPQALENRVAELTLPSSEIVGVQADVGTGKWPRTIRWRYSIGCASLP